MDWIEQFTGLSPEEASARFLDAFEQAAPETELPAALAALGEVCPEAIPLVEAEWPGVHAAVSDVLGSD